MIYPTNFEDKTGFTQIRQLLTSRCTFRPGCEAVERMAFCSERTSIEQQLDETQELMTLLADESSALPAFNFHDLRESFLRIRVEGLFLDEQELFSLRQTLSSIHDLTAYFAHIDDTSPTPCPLLKARAATIVPVADLLRDIDRVIDRYGQIKDNASPQLASLRQDLRRAQGSVSRTLNTILRQAQEAGMVEHDVSPTLREGRLVIPISPQYKRHLHGIVHDESASGKTIYIEPTQVVEANNHIRELESEERREVMHILESLTAQIRPLIPDLLDAIDYLGFMDFLHAKALLAAEMDAIRPRLADEPVVEWQQAVHPLLRRTLERQGKHVVPLDILLNDQQRILLISGPNAGGKSVCLKTVALLQYMMQCGMPVPVGHNTVMGIFHDIFIDIGDEQSIDDDLSTYSSHLRNMKHFVRHSTHRTLLLIDEFGGGTEPQIGGAIAQATLEQLNRNQAFGVITTHYSNLKHFAEDTEGIVNGAMLYDRRRLQPLFTLEMGRPGSSFAIEIARNIGLNESIITKAEEIVGSDYVNYDKHLQDIARDKRYWQQKRQKIHEQERQLDDRIKRYDAELETLRTQRRKAMTQAREEAAQLLQQTHAVIENTVRRIKESNADSEATRAARRKMQNFEQNLQRSVQNDEKKAQRAAARAANNKQTADTLKVGGYARIKGQTMIGQIIELDGRRAVVVMGELKTTVDASRLEPMSNNNFRRQNASRRRSTAMNIDDDLRQRKLNFSHDIDVRGMRGDEALQAITYFIDDAIMVGAGTVRILHGTGTGALRQLIRQYLDTVPGLHYRDEHVQMGGAGITVVEL